MKTRKLLVSAVVGALVAALVTVVLPAGPAQAHGNVISPASRNYGCFIRWGDHFQDPAMATEDPMCYQAWQADPNAMWNWNGLFREGVAGNHQGVIPDGQLCSAGHTQSGRYNALDTVGDWKATTVGNNFTVQVFDQALHGADYLWVYVTNPGFNPVTTALKWSDLTRVAVVGNTPASQWTPVTGGVQLTIPVAGGMSDCMHVFDRVIRHQQAVLPFEVFAAISRLVDHLHFLDQTHVFGMDPSANQFERYWRADLNLVNAIELC